jgi:hypothetical protein
MPLLEIYNLAKGENMLKKTLSFLLIVLLLNAVGVNSAYAGTNEEKEDRFTERVREGIRKLGTGTEARIEVKLRDKRKLKGYITEAGADSFSVVDTKTGVATPVAYPQVKQVKGNNLSEGVKIAIALGALAAAIIVAVYFVSQTK